VLIATKSFAIEALVKMFFQQEELAKTEEKKTDEILDGENKQTEKPAKDAPLKAHTQYIEETIALRKYNIKSCMSNIPLITQRFPNDVEHLILKYLG